MTCADQTFFTPFVVREHAIQLYMMNFKKGSQITKDKLTKENKMSSQRKLYSEYFQDNFVMFKNIKKHLKYTFFTSHPELREYFITVLQDVTHTLL